MDVNSFLGALSAPVKTAPPPQAPVGGVAPADEEPQGSGGHGEGPVVEEQLSDATTDITPSGIEVLYQSKPKRLYKVNGVEVPSVTTVLGVLDKPGLPYWGMKIGVDGVLSLIEDGHLTSAFDWDTERERLALSEGEYATRDNVVDLLVQHRLTVNHMRDKAAGRGVNVHQALEDWARIGKMPNVSEFDETEQGYVQALVKFLEDVDPTPVHCEVMVGSAEHGFAGRYDVTIETATAREYTSRFYPKKADKRETLDPGRFMLDAKSSSGVYLSHHRQLEAYEAASVEGGYEPTDERFVLHLGASGKYELVKSVATFEDFLVVLAVWQSDQRLKDAA